ncbi:ADP-ribosylation factor-like protein 16 [Lytechinus variegatus]|uniref:ADP-ribosylation factor-like protein 16 n=1 Tax=Lytechinus variegatus TaxID=7654 RepID=UPI001BB0F0D2|nr:ADP-ribosylation factor-like protein 16 [Lytechinus variegatus]
MCLLLGPLGVGKTLILKRLQVYSTKGSFENLNDAPSTIPTVGTNLTNVQLNKKIEVRVRELGGMMAPIWPNYFTDSSIVLYVVDVSNMSQVSSACIQLLQVLTDPKLQNASILVVLNKSDLPLPMSMQQIRSLLHLDDIANSASQRIEVLQVSALTGQGLDEVVRWLSSNAKG